MNNDKDIFRKALQRQNERAARMKMPDDMEQRVMEHIKPKHRRVWLYPAIATAAAIIALLIMIHFDKNITDEQPTLIAQTDTMQTTIKKVEELPVQKEKNTEVTDSVKMIKDKYRMPRPPKHYMAKAEITEITPAPDTIDATELAERAFAEEKRRLEMEMMSQMQGSLQADFKGLTDEIRSRGERMSQQVEMALNDDEY